MKIDGQRKWTVAELIAHLQTLPPTNAVVLRDADTDWIIDQFSVQYTGGNEVTFFPSSYSEMRR